MTIHCPTDDSQAAIPVHGRETSQGFKMPLLKGEMRGLRQADAMTGSILAVQETRPKFLFPRTGQVQAGPGLRNCSAIWHEERTMG